MSKTQELKNFNYFGISHKGNIRKENEDAFAQFETINGTFFILCDGMGGVKGGKEAAELTIKYIKEFVENEWEENPKEIISNAIEFANNTIYQYFLNKNPLLKPGSTIVLVLFRDNKIYYAHAGDSRIYYQTGEKIFLLTKDHSHVMNLVEKKIITKEEARTHKRRNEITKAVGIKKTIEPKICKDFISPADNDNLLLCSDGLTGELTDNEILKILIKEKTVEEKAKLLKNKVLKRTAQDNITVQLINFYNTGKEKNTHFDKKYNKKRIFQILLFFILLLITGIIFYFTKINNKETGIFKAKKQITKSRLLMLKSKRKDTLINFFMFKNNNIKEVLNKFGLVYTEIGQSSGLDKKSGYKKYFVPVKNVYIHKPGKLIWSYPEIYSCNSKDLIDIIIVNNKNELYFKPGEKIIIPRYDKPKN